MQEPSPDARSLHWSLDKQSPGCVRGEGAGAAPRREPAPHCSTRTCRSLRVATPVSCGRGGDGPADCTRGWQDVASACAGADVYESRYPSGSGVRQAAPGDVVRSKAFPRPGLPVRRGAPRTAARTLSPCLCHPSASLHPKESSPWLGCGQAA